MKIIIISDSNMPSLIIFKFYFFDFKNILEMANIYIISNGNLTSLIIFKF